MLNASVLLTNTNRSKAYLQNLVKNNYIPQYAIVLEKKSEVLPEQQNVLQLNNLNIKQQLYQKINNVKAIFDEKENIIQTLIKYKIPHIIIDSFNVNSQVVINAIKKCPTDYIIYSGPSGSILKEKILEQKKRFIYVHDGLLPEYKGSTTIYYSMLFENKISCSVVILGKSITVGSILYVKDFTFDDMNIDFDNILDPLVRAETLIEFIIQNNGILDERHKIIQQDLGTTYYTIHPILKHISILKYKKELNKLS